MRRNGILGGVVALVAATGAIALSRANATASPPLVNHPPVVTSSLPPNATYGPAEPVRITVTVTDPDGDPVYARVVEGPRELSFTPVRNAPSGVTREIVYFRQEYWYGNQDLGPQRFVVEAWDARQPWRKTRTTFRFRILGGPSSHGLRLLQLDQDAAPEILACARLGDVAGVADAGAYAMFDAPYGSTRLDADPALWSADPLESGDLYRHEEQIGDLNADGLDDVVAVVAQERVAIWFGGTSRGTRPPDVTLRSSTPRIHYYTPAALLVADVTGDGIDDVVMGFPWADTDRKRAGEVQVFAGGPSFAARASTPTATLRVPHTSNFEGIGWTYKTFDPFRVGDVNGDGVADLLVVSPFRKIGGTGAVGAIYVWSGGAALAGTPAPVATLATTGGSQSSELGLADNLPAFFLVDVTGDGQLDVVAAAPDTPPEGAIFLWQGGSGIAGTVAPTARLEPSPGGWSGNGSELPDVETLSLAQGLVFADVNLDGITDVIAARSRATVGGAGVAGSIYVFAGGSISGTVNETAILRRTTPQPYDFLATANDGLQVVDVTGDGAPDVVSGSPSTNASPNGHGAIEVFAARSGLSGTLTPSASLEVPGAGNVGLTATGFNSQAFSTGLLVEDVTGDGIRDIVGVAALQDYPSLHEGAIHVWAGGSNLTSGATVAPSATLRDPNPPPNSRLGSKVEIGPAVHFVDWDDDGVKDLVAFENVTNTRGATLRFESRVLVWRGGATLTGMPAPFAIAPSIQADDGFGGLDGAAGGLWFGDVTGDDQVDLLVTAPNYDTLLNEDAGSIYVFAGGPTSSGTLAPVAVLEDPFGLAGDEFGGASELAIADVDSDGLNDLIATSPEAGGTGRILLFHGPIGSATTGHDLFAPKLGDSPGLGEGNPYF